MMWLMLLCLLESVVHLPLLAFSKSGSSFTVTFIKSRQSVNPAGLNLSNPH